MPQEILQSGIEQAEKENYLGDPEVVETLLRQTLSLVCENFSEPEEKFLALVKSECERLAKIFLGEDPQYAPIDGWNKPGFIDKYLDQKNGHESESPEASLFGCFASFITSAIKIINYAGEPDVKDEHWNWQVDDLLNEYTHVLLGIPYHDGD